MYIPFWAIILILILVFYMGAEHYKKHPEDFDEEDFDDHPDEPI